MNSMSARFPFASHPAILRVLLGGSLLAAAAASGDTLTWNNPRGGDWNTPANWSPARRPTAADDLVIDLAGTYTVTQSVAGLAHQLMLGGTPGAQPTLLSRAPLGTGGTLSIAPGGILRCSGNVTSTLVRIEGRLEWTGGALVAPAGITGVVEVARGGVLAMTNAVSRTLTRQVLTNSGTIHWSQGNLTGSGGAELWNGGLLDDATATPVPAATALSLGAAFHHLPSGSIVLTNATLSFAQGGEAQGQVEVRSPASFRVTSTTAPFEVSATALFSGSGPLWIAGWVRFVGPANPAPLTLPVHLASGQLAIPSGLRAEVDTLELAGGALVGPGELNVLDSTLWLGSDLRTNIVLTCHGSLFVTNTATHPFAAGRLRNAGNAIWRTATLQSSPGPSAITNLPGGVFVVGDGARWTSPGTGSARFENAGSLTVPAGATGLTIDGDFHNTGALTLPGTLALDPTSGRFTQSAGLLQLAGGTLRAPAGLEFAAGRLEGTGLLDGDVHQRTAFRLPAGSAGLHVAGDLAFEGAASLEVELPLDPSNPPGHLLIDGVAGLAGSVLPIRPSGFVAPTGTAFPFLTSPNPLQGRFARLLDSATPPTLRLQEVDRSARLEVVPAGELTLWVGDPALTNRGLTLGAEQSFTFPVTVSLAGRDPTDARLSVAAADPTVLAPALVLATGAGRERFVTIRPGLTNFGTTTLTIDAAGPAGQHASLSISLRIDGAPTQGLLAWEPFDYPDGASLWNQVGGFGFSAGWARTVGFTNRLDSLPYAGLNSSANHLAAEPSRTALSQGRILARPLRSTGTTRYIAFLARADDPVVPGRLNDYFGLLVQGNASGYVFVGKPGVGATDEWVLEDAGGTHQHSTGVPVVTGATTLLVLRIDFDGATDRLSLYVNPVPGQPEPPTPQATRTDRSVTPISSLTFTSTGGWSVDELRVGTTWESTVPVPGYLPPLGVLPIPDLIATEGALITYPVQLAQEISPRQRHFELVPLPGGTLPRGLAIAEATGVISYSPGESEGNTTLEALVRVHDTPEPPSRSAETPLRVRVQESNQAPDLNSPTPEELVVTRGFPFALTLHPFDLDLPPNPVRFAKVSGPDTLTIDPSGAIAWTPPADFPLGPTNLGVRLTDSNEAAPAATRSLSTIRTVALEIRDPAPDPAVEVTTAPRETHTDRETVFEITVRNRGLATATGVELRLELPELATVPPLVRLSRLELSQGTYTANQAAVVCALGDLPAGGTARATFVLVFTLDGSENPQWRITSTSIDDDATNNRADAPLRVLATQPSPPANPLVWHASSASYAFGRDRVRMASDPFGQSHLLSSSAGGDSQLSSWNGLGWSHENVPNQEPIAYRIFGETRSAAQFGELGGKVLRWTKNNLNLAYGTKTHTGLSGGVFLRDGLFSDTGGDYVLVGLSEYSLDSYRGHIPFALSAPVTSGEPGPWTLRPTAPVDSSTHNIDFRLCAPVNANQLVALIYDQTLQRSAIVLCHTIPPNLKDLEEVESFPGSAVMVEGLLTATRLNSGFATCYVDPAGSLKFARQIEGRWSVEPVDGIGTSGIVALKLVGDVSDTPTLLVCTSTYCDSDQSSPDCPDRNIWRLGRRLGSGWSWSEIYRTEDTGFWNHPKEFNVVDQDMEAFGPELRVALTTGLPDLSLKWLRLAPKWELFPDAAPALPETQPRLASGSDGTVFVASTGSPSTADFQISMLQFSGSNVGLSHRREHVFGSPQPIAVHAWDRVGAIVTSPASNTDESWLYFYREDPTSLPWQHLGVVNHPVDRRLPETLFRGESPDTAWLVGFDKNHRPFANLASTLSGDGLEISTSDSGPALAAAPTAVAYAEVNDGLTPFRLYTVYHTGPPANELRVAEFDRTNWVSDRLLTRVDIANTPHGGPGLLAAHWGLNLPFDDASNLGVLYAAYSARAPDGTVTLRVGRLDLGNALATWQETTPTQPPAFPYGLQSLSLSGLRESLKIAFSDRLLYLLHADLVSDFANVERATLETLPTPAPVSNVEVLFKGESTWLAFIRSNHVHVLATGVLRDDRGLDSTTGLPWRPSLLPPDNANTGNICAASTLWILANFQTDPRGDGVFKEYPPASSPSARSRAALAGTPDTNNPAPNTPLSRQLADPRLGTLRHARDLMLETTEGRRLVELYRRFSPEVRRRFYSDPQVFRAGLGVLMNFLPHANAWVEGRGASIKLSPTLIAIIDRFWSMLADGASPELRVALTTERDRFHGFQDFSGQTMDTWATKLGLPNTASAATAPRIVAHRLDSAGFTVTLDGTGTGLAHLRRSVALTDNPWEPVSDAIASTDASGHPTFTDPHPPAGTAFYRVEWSPGAAIR